MTTKHHTLQVIEDHYDQMTELEKLIADFFMRPDSTFDDLSSLTVAKTLHVSQPALTRFAKKCGFTGYREFIYDFQTDLKSLNVQFPQIKDDLTKRVLMDYDELSQKTQELLDEDQLKQVAQMIEQSQRVYFFGKGSSGLVAREMKLRLMRLGVVCEALTENDSFTWTTSILDDSCLVLGITLSGTPSVIESLTRAKDRGAKTVLLITQLEDKYQIFDQVIPIASTRHLNFGTRISPQFPLLIAFDILYAHFFEINKDKKEAIFKTFWN